MSSPEEHAVTAGGVQHLAVCIPTYRRPRMLAACLAAVARLEIPNACRIRVIVADNDAGASARGQVEGLQAEFPFPLSYVTETRRGLASIRNRLLREALAAGADWIAFLDDDEMPAPDWLSQLARAAQEHRADVVTGPLLQVNETAPLDAASGGRRQAGGATPRHVATNNVMFRSSLVAAQDLWFDHYYDFIGGEDFDFFNRSTRLGNRHVWVPDALVYERVPQERTTLGYLFYRHFTGAINNVLRHRKDRGILSSWLHFLPKLAGKLLASPVYAVIAAVAWNGDTGRKALKMLASGLGYVAGLLNIIVERYRTLDGN